MPEIKKASCLFCSLQCGFALEVDSGVPVRVDFDADAPTNRGALCARGHYNLELLLHPKRYLAASINRRRVPLTSAVSKVAGKISEIKNAHGANSLAVIVGTELSNEDYDAASGFARSVLGTDKVAVAYDGNDYPMLLGGGAGDASPEDLDEADAFVIVGDVFWGHPSVAKRIIDARHSSRSNAIYTINPYRTNTDWFADGHITVSPGTEPVVLAAILTAMNAQGAPKMSAESAGAVADLSPEEIRDIAADLKGKQKVVVLASARLGDSTSAYLTGVLAAKLAAAAGGKYAPLFRGGNAIGAFERIGSSSTVPEILKGVADKSIKGLIVLGPDLLQLYPGAVTSESLEDLELLAASALFENDTARYSDVGLPQSSWTEADGSYSGSLGVTNNVTQVAEPQGDAIPVREALAVVAAELDAAIPAGPAKAENAPLELDVNAALAKLAGVKRPEGVSLIENIHPLHRWDGGITGRMSFPQTQQPYCEVWIGEGAAGELGVAQGGNVWLATDRGETILSATVTDRMPGGLVAIPSYAPDARCLLTWTANAGTRWFDVTASGAKVTPEA